MNYYIKERYNPQTGTYFVAMGQLSARDARGHCESLYGSNTMHAFATKEEYETRLAQLRDGGEKVQ
jgi:hypothetical protein